MTRAEKLKKMEALWDHVQAFIDEQDITCSETVYQTDRVILNAYEFIDGACEIVGFKTLDWDDE